MQKDLLTIHLYLWFFLSGFLRCTGIFNYRINRKYHKFLRQITQNEGIETHRLNLATNRVSDASLQSITLVLNSATIDNVAVLAYFEE